MIYREHYIKPVRDFYESDLIKIITGIRRCGKSVILVKDGKFIKENLKNEKLTINDVLEDLRSGGNYDLSKIGFAILERSGKIAVIQKNNENEKVYLPTSIIIDGEIVKEGLKYINRNNDWLMKQLKENKIKSPKDVLYAYTDSNGTFKYQLETK